MLNANFVASFRKMQLIELNLVKWGLRNAPSGFTVSHMQQFSSPSHPPPLVTQATSKLLLHWLCKWNIILARYGKVELAVSLTTDDMPGHSQYMRTWHGFFSQSLWLCGFHCCRVAEYYTQTDSFFLFFFWRKCHQFTTCVTCPPFTQQLPSKYSLARYWAECVSFLY